jgi:hypothetical protein
VRAVVLPALPQGQGKPAVLGQLFFWSGLNSLPRISLLFYAHACQFVKPVLRSPARYLRGAVPRPGRGAVPRPGRGAVPDQRACPFGKPSALRACPERSEGASARRLRACPESNEGASSERSRRGVGSVVEGRTVVPACAPKGVSARLPSPCETSPPGDTPSDRSPAPRAFGGAAGIFAKHPCVASQAQPRDERSRRATAAPSSIAAPSACVTATCMPKRCKGPGPPLLVLCHLSPQFVC